MSQPADRGPDAHAGDSRAAIPRAAADRARMRSKPGLDTAIRQHRRAALVVNARSRRGSRLYPAGARPGVPHDRHIRSHRRRPLLRRHVAEIEMEMERLAALRAGLLGMLAAMPGPDCPDPLPGTWCPRG